MHAAHWKCRTQKIAKNLHLCAIAQLYRAVSSQLRHVSTIGKNLLNSNTSSTCARNMLKLRPTNGWDRFWSLGHPANFNGFRVLTALLHGTLVVGVSQTLRRWTEGATYIWQGGHHVRQLAHILVMAALHSRCGHYIFALWFLLLLSSFFFLSSPNLSRQRLDVYHTSTHRVALVRI